MTEPIDIAVVGLGKMGLSHLAMVNAHPLARTVACDGSGFLADVLSRNLSVPVHKDYEAMLASERLDAVLIATPSKLHGTMVRAALERGLHVFCEKPFCLDWEEGAALAGQAEAAGRVAQVGYHYRYVGAFREMKRLLDAGAIGRVTQVLAEAYGPVVLRPKRATWRTKAGEGGGSLYDYAAHPLNLLNWFFGLPDRVTGSALVPVFSDGIDDQVTSTLQWDGRGDAEGSTTTAQLSVNWSDESHRKMSTKITIIGTGGRLQADRQECQAYLRAAPADLPGYVEGWNVRYTTELTGEVGFYLRGEEYSAQVDDFVTAVAGRRTAASANTFREAAETDRTMAMILENAATGGLAGAAAAAPRARRGWFGRG